MADVKQLNINNTTYDIKDSNARTRLSTLETETVNTAGTALSKSGRTLNHSNYGSAGTAGTSSATSGSTIQIPYITTNAQGHVTAKGEHTHTIPAIPNIVTGTYVYNSVSTTEFSFTDNNTAGKNYIICGTQDAGNPVLRAKKNGTTIKVYLADPVTVMRVNYICF